MPALGAEKDPSLSSTCPGFCGQQQTCVAKGVIAQRWLPKLPMGSLVLQRLIEQLTPSDPLHVQLICTSETSEKLNSAPRPSIWQPQPPAKAAWQMGREGVAVGPPPGSETKSLRASCANQWHQHPRLVLPLQSGTLRQTVPDCNRSAKGEKKSQCTEEFQLLTTTEKVVTFSDNTRINSLRML